MAGGYKAYIDPETLYMAYAPGTMSANYLKIANSALTALQPCKIKLWTLPSGASGTGTYTEHTLNTGDAVSVKNIVTFAMVYEP